jgi:hypothetical protein
MSWGAASDSIQVALDLDCTIAPRQFVRAPSHRPPRPNGAGEQLAWLDLAVSPPPRTAPGM